MKQHLNTLYVTTQQAYLAKDGEAVDVRVERESRLRVPLLNLGGIVCFGNVTCSPYLMAACAEAGIAISFLTERGRFLAAVQGFTPGNVLLRREQYRRADDPAGSVAIARNIVGAKIANERPGGHLKIPHLWPGQTPPPSSGGTRDVMRRMCASPLAPRLPSDASSCLQTSGDGHGA